MHDIIYSVQTIYKLERVRSGFKRRTILIRELVRTDFKLRYSESILGYMWSILKPLAMFTILYFVFAKVFRVGDVVPHYAVYLLMGVMLWNYFSEVTSSGVTAIIEKGDLMRKIDFDKNTIMISKSASALINLGLYSAVLALFIIIFGADVQLWLLPLVPLLLVELIVFAYSISKLLATVYVRFRDMSYIWDVALQALFYATPLLYPISFVVDNFSLLAAKILLLNPVAQITQDLRTILVTNDKVSLGSVYGEHEWWARLFSIMLVVVTWAIAALYFNKHKKRFAEYV